MNNQLTRALKLRSFLFLWLAEIFSQVAANMMNFILILVVYKLTNSSTAVSGIVLSFTVPAIIFGVMAGVLVDRWSKKKVLYVANIVRAVFALLLAFFHTDIALVYIFSLIVTIGTQFFIPAETPIIPMIVKRDMLISANALFGIALYGSLLVSYALSGPFLVALGSTKVFFILALFFLIASVFVLFVKTKTEEDIPKKILKEPLDVSITDEIKMAFSFAFKSREIRQSFVFLTIAQILILVMSVIGPGYAKTVLNIPVDDFPLLFVTPAAIGMIFGAILLTNYFHRFSKQFSASIGLLLSAVAVFLMPFGSKVASREFVQSINALLPYTFQITIVHIMVVLAFFIGIANALIFVPSNALLQEVTSDEMRGKIYGTLNALVALASLFPVILAGSLADVFGVNSVLITLAVVMGMIGIWRLILDRNNSKVKTQKAKVVKDA